LEIGAAPGDRRTIDQIKQAFVDANLEHLLPTGKEGKAYFVRLAKDHLKGDC
jgi:hypothetical protein